MKTIEEVMAKTSEVFEDIRTQKLNVQQAKEMNKAAMTIIKAAQTKLAYNKFQNINTKIEFLSK